MKITYLIALIICILSFLAWVWSLIVLITVKKNDSAPPETVSLRKRAIGLNIALIIMTVFGSFILYFHLLGIAMIVISALCIIDSVKLLKARQQVSQQYYQPPQQTGGVQQEQPAPQQQSEKCPHCGAEVEEGSYFCEHCGNKI